MKNGYDLKDVSGLPGPEWDSMVDCCAHSTVYHRDGWLGALSGEEAADFRRIACFRDGALMGIWPVGLLRKGPLRIAGSPLPGWNTAYLGPLFTSECDDRLGVVRAVLRGRPVSNPSFMATRCTDTELDLAPLGFECTKRFMTYEINLEKSEDELFSALKGTCRTRVRKGTKNGLVVRIEDDGSYIEDFCRMAEDVFAKSRLRPPFSRAFLTAVHERLFERGELLVTSACFDGERIGTLIVPHDGRTAVYFAGGSFADKLHLAPNNLLHWETILACRGLGLSQYDFISTSGKPGKFKNTFGPDERVSCVHWERSKSPAIKWVRDKYEQMARKRRKVKPTGFSE